jgi:hypothetical protein
MAQRVKPSAAPEALVLKLPHPYLTSYEVTTSATEGSLASHQILPSTTSSGSPGIAPPTLLHNDAVSFSEIAFVADDAGPSKGDNSSWARARRSPFVTVSWTAEQPTVPQMWLIAYALVSQHPLVEHLRVVLSGRNSQLVAQELYATGLFYPHPRASTASAPHDGHLLLRGAFWQGAASPFGARPVWAPHLDASGKPITTQYPSFPYHVAPSTQFPALPRHTWHPVRQPKPEPGSIVYSRWIPHLQEHFTLSAVDYTNPDHVNLFHKWQNDPRVAAAWNETGTVEEHREYLRKLHEDPHVVTVFGAFDGIFFSYFEIYWAMVCHFHISLYTHANNQYRKTTWAPTFNRRHMTVVGIHWSATRGLEVLTAWLRGGQE